MIYPARLHNEFNGETRALEVDLPLVESAAAAEIVAAVNRVAPLADGKDWQDHYEVRHTIRIPTQVRVELESNAPSGLADLRRISLRIDLVRADFLALDRAAEQRDRDLLESAISRVTALRAELSEALASVRQHSAPSEPAEELGVLSRDAVDLFAVELALRERLATFDRVLAKRRKTLEQLTEAPAEQAVPQVEEKASPPTPSAYAEETPPPEDRQAPEEALPGGEVPRQGDVVLPVDSSERQDLSDESRRRKPPPNETLPKERLALDKRRAEEATTARRYETLDWQEIERDLNRRARELPRSASAEERASLARRIAANYGISPEDKVRRGRTENDWIELGGNAVRRIARMLLERSQKNFLQEVGAVPARASEAPAKDERPRVAVTEAAPSRTGQPSGTARTGSGQTPAEARSNLLRREVWGTDTKPGTCRVIVDRGAKGFDRLKVKFSNLNSVETILEDLALAGGLPLVSPTGLSAALRGRKPSWAERYWLTAVHRDPFLVRLSLTPKRPFIIVGRGGGLPRRESLVFEILTNSSADDIGERDGDPVIVAEAMKWATLLKRAGED